MARHKDKKKGKGSKGQNRKNTESFLEKNLQKEGVVQTNSGLQYSIIEQIQNTPRPDREAMVTVHQRITLIDGTIVADTYKTGEKEEFSIAEAIDGLKEGLQMMTEGSRYKFFIPPELAWGKRGAGNKIGPFATLIVDIKLISFY